jgi:hypothetical protein
MGDQVVNSKFVVSNIISANREKKFVMQKKINKKNIRLNASVNACVISAFITLLLLRNK